MKRRADRASLRGGVMFDIDGVLVGGASLKAEEFVKMIKAIA